MAEEVAFGWGVVSWLKVSVESKVEIETEVCLACGFVDVWNETIVIWLPPPPSFASASAEKIWKVDEDGRGTALVEEIDDEDDGIFCTTV